MPWLGSRPGTLRARAPAVREFPARPLVAWKASSFAFRLYEDGSSSVWLFRRFSHKCCLSPVILHGACSLALAALACRVRDEWVTGQSGASILRFRRVVSAAEDPEQQSTYSYHSFHCFSTRIIEYRAYRLRGCAGGPFRPLSRTNLQTPS